MATTEAAETKVPRRSHARGVPPLGSVKQPPPQRAASRPIVDFLWESESRLRPDSLAVLSEVVPATFRAGFVSDVKEMTETLTARGELDVDLATDAIIEAIQSSCALARSKSKDVCVEKNSHADRASRDRQDGPLSR